MYILILLHLTKLNKIIEMGSSINRTSTRKLLSHHKIQQSRLNFIKGSIRSRWSNRVLRKSLLFVLLKSHNLVFLAEFILANWSNPKTAAAAARAGTNFFVFLN